MYSDKRQEAFVGQHNTEHDLRTERRNATREEVRCRCIEKAIAEYARTWVDLQSGDITPEKAKSKLTLHLTAHCIRRLGKFAQLHRRRIDTAAHTEAVTLEHDFAARFPSFCNHLTPLGSPTPC